MAKIGEKVNGVLLIDEIGAGSSGVVFRGKAESDGEVLAVKMIRINKATQMEDKKTIQNEMNVGFGKASPFLVNYREVVMKEDECFIFFEYFPGGDLGKVIEQHVKENKPFSEEEICTFILEVGTGLKTLHDLGIMHRDLKPSNIFITASKVYKIGDYSLARYKEAVAGRSQTLTGTIGYMAPELLEGKKIYSFEVDIFSFGCIIWYMMFLRHPFSNVDGSINQRMLLLGKPTDGGNKTLCSVALQSLVHSMIAVDSSDRPPIEAVLSLPLLQNTRTAQTEAQVRELTTKTITFAKEIEELKKRNSVVEAENFDLKKENTDLKKRLAEMEAQRIWRGVKTWPAGDAKKRVHYSGEWRGQMREGRGVQTFVNGDKYDGGWVLDEMAGKGVMVYSNGQRYEGEWAKGKREGKGVLVFAANDKNERVKYTGDWKADRREGKGTMIYKDGNKFEVEYKKDQQSGKGTIWYPNG